MFVVDMEPVQHQIHVYVVQIMLEQIVNWLFVSERMKVIAMCAMVTALVQLQILAVVRLDTTALIAAAMIVAVFCLATVQFVLVMEHVLHLVHAIATLNIQGQIVKLLFVMDITQGIRLFVLLMAHVPAAQNASVVRTMLEKTASMQFALD